MSAIKKRPRIKTRFGWLTVILPIIGPIFAGGVRAPTFDDVEKMLQLFGLVSALILSVVADAASYDDLNPNSRTIQGRAYSAFGFCVASVIHVLIVYIYLVTCVDQESGTADIQMQKFWYLGKLNMVLQVGFIVMAVFEYITYVNSTLYDGYASDSWDPSGIEHYGDNYFGFFVGWAGIMFTIVFIIIMTHVLALPVLLYNDKTRCEECDEFEAAAAKVKLTCEPGQTAPGPDGPRQQADTGP